MNSSSTEMFTHIEPSFDPLMFRRYVSQHIQLGPPRPTTRWAPVHVILAAHLGCVRGVRVLGHRVGTLVHEGQGAVQYQTISPSV